MEKLRLHQLNEYTLGRGVSLKDLVNEIPTNKKGHPRKMDKIIWLAEAMETIPFWDELNRHLITDNKKRHSAGGLFYRESGEKMIGKYTWHEVYSDLDRFLQKIDSKATEFIFRDFNPRQNDSKLTRRIQTVRENALERFPRLRRMYWEDYEEGLETVFFWKGMNEDLKRLPGPVSVHHFFDIKKSHHKEIDMEGKTVLSTNQLEKYMITRFVLQTGQMEKRSQIMDYQSMAQIIEGLLSQDPRNFLLKYQLKSETPSLQKLVFETKKLILQKILPIQPVKERLKIIPFTDLEQIIQTDTFWQTLLTDLNKHAASRIPTYNFNFFLRHYDRNSNEVMPNRIGEYTELCTAFAKHKKGIASQIVKDPSKELVNYLMWGFKPDAKFEKTVLETKKLAAELFPQDCLYVELQNPEFWKRFKEDILKTKKPMALAMFLRYFSDNNIGCERKFHKPGTAFYQRLLFRSYHQPEDLKSLCEYLKIPTFDNYKINLRSLIFQLSPDSFKELLKTKFPVDFDAEAKIKKAEEVVIFDRTKNYLKTLITNPTKPLIIYFSSTEELNQFRKKKSISVASRSLKIHIKTSVGKDNSLIVELRKRKKLNKVEVAEMEKKVKELRQQKLTNKEIAEKLGLEKDYNAEYLAQKLIRKGELQSRIKYQE